MSFLTSNQSKQDKRSALAELIFAGHGMAKYFFFRGQHSLECVCGPIAGPAENPEVHHRSCPVGRLYAAINAVDKAVL